MRRDVSIEDLLAKATITRAIVRPSDVERSRSCCTVAKTKPGRCVEDTDRPLEVRRLTGETVEVVGDDPVDGASFEVGQQALELRTLHLDVEGRVVVVLVDAGDLPAAEAGDRSGVVLLAADAQPEPLRVRRDPAVDPHPHETQVSTCWLI